jgi:dTDP-4-amino-4,6-dideoxygalactose transaminase
MIPINRPDIGIHDISDYLNNGEDLELFFTEWLGSNRVNLVTSSGKMSIYLLFKHLQLSGSVLTSPMCCSMAFAPIVANGLDLKFIDTDSDSFCMNLDLLEDQIDENTSAIYVAHLGGWSPDMERLRRISDEYNILLIEDCAQALGSLFNDKKIGTYGDYSCFSFSKNIWLSGGGAISAKNNKVLNKIRQYQEELPEVSENLIRYRFERDTLESRRGICKTSDELYYGKFYKESNNANIAIDYVKYFDSMNVKSKPSKLQKSIVLDQIKELDSKNASRNRNAQIIISKLSRKYNFQKMNGMFSVYTKLYLTSKKRISAMQIISKLAEVGIDAKHLTKSHGIHFQSRFDQDENFKDFFQKDSCRCYKEMHEYIFSIPISSCLSKNEIYRICSELNKI